MEAGSGSMAAFLGSRGRDFVGGREGGREGGKVLGFNIMFKTRFCFELNDVNLSIVKIP